MRIVKNILKSLLLLLVVVGILFGFVYFKHKRAMLSYNLEAEKYVDGLLAELGKDWDPATIFKRLPRGMVVKANTDAFDRFFESGRALGEFKGNSLPRLDNSRMRLTTSGFIYIAEYRARVTFENGYAWMFVRMLRRDSVFELLELTLVPDEE